MSSWIVPAIVVPVALGISTSFSALKRSNSDWHTRLRKPQYNMSHWSLLPTFIFIYTVQGIAAYLVSNEMMVGTTTPEIIAQTAGQSGLGFYWLQLLFLAVWPRLLAFGPGLKLAMGDLSVAVVGQVVAMVQFFRVSVAGGVLMLGSLLVCVGLAVWNLALVRKSAAGRQ